MFCPPTPPDSAAGERQELERNPESISPGKLQNDGSKDSVTETKLIKMVQLLALAAPRLNV